MIECCLSVAQRLRCSCGQPPSPFDEIRASSALLLWSLLAAPGRNTPTTRSLSRAAQRFWGVVLARVFDGTSGVASARRPWRHVASTRDQRTAYALRLFNRTWGPVDGGTRSWLLGSLPPFARPDAVLGELSLDWLLWDAPWLKGHPGAHWAVRASRLLDQPRVRAAHEAILRSRLGLWRIEEQRPGRGFLLCDRLTGERTPLHTDSDPWPDAAERLLLARVYAFGDWRLVGGRSLLLDATAVDRLLTALQTRAAALAAPAPGDPRWRAWLKAELAPVVAAEWLASRLAPLPPDRYHGTYC